MVAGIDFHYRGFHNVDLVYNMKYISQEADFNIDGWIDTYNSKVDSIDLNELYLVGLEQMGAALYLVMGGALLVGLGLTNIR